ncbi:MAG: histidinol-phosphate transaminase [Arenicellales bacterium]|nr:histidinol-phosphate transaminase [Arenicellales bacterium]MDP7155794.1 histidinol-phosphate transaminase [Arenicellales bacterium]MDP7482538.1 histidinol-phosphate transaminase [Arenicellales bacterium]
MSVESLISRWVREPIQKLKAYYVPDASGMIKLEAMENPYSFPQELQSEWLGVLSEISLNRYPDPQAVSLRKKMVDVMDVPEGASLLLGNGSDELIQLLMLALGGEGRSVLAPTPSFVMYEMAAIFTGTEFIGVPLKGDFSLDLDKMLESISQHRPAIVFLAYPNNPTGNLFSRSDVEAVIKAAPGVVVIDEAYHAFARSSFIKDVVKTENLLVMRTLSKWGLAGLRVGLLAASTKWIDELDKVRLPYNINALSQASASFALTHKKLFDQQAGQIIEARGEVMEQLAAMDGVEVFSSDANFILFRVANASDLYSRLCEAGILIKNLDAHGAPLENCLRVTIGAKEENEQFLHQFCRLME